jgi:hypothetical protein
MGNHQQKSIQRVPLQTSKSLIIPTWDEAFLRVESYLRAHGLESRVRLNQITSEVIQEARARWFDDEQVAPVLIAMQLTRERIDAWLVKIDLATEPNREKSAADARVALILADLPGRWSDCLLNAGVLPEEFTARLNSTRVLPTPELRVSNMPPAPLEFGSVEPTEPRLGAWRASVCSRAALAWIFILGLFSAAWAASH